jgi:thioredoxin 1
MSADTPSVLELTEASFAASINDHPFAVVDFWAPWCAPCRAFAPTFAAAAAKHPDVLFAKVNTEDQQAIGAHFNIRSIPTLMIFRNNIIVYAEAGALPASALDQVLESARALDMEQIRREIDAEAAAAPERS